MKPVIVFLGLVLICGCIGPETAEVSDTEGMTSNYSEDFQEAKNETPSVSETVAESGEEEQNLPINETDSGSSNTSNESTEEEIPGKDFNESENPHTGPNAELIKEVLNSYDENEPESYNNVNRLLNVESREMFPLLQHNETVHQWTALYILSNTAYLENASTQSEVRKEIDPFLYSGNPDFKLISAITILGLGDKEGISILIDLLEDDSLFMLSEPPMLICQYSNFVLERYTDTEFDFYCTTEYVNSESIQKWKDWWDQNSENASWDADQEKLVVK